MVDWTEGMAKGKTSILVCRAEGAGGGLSETVVCPVFFVDGRSGYNRAHFKYK
jgi:hypothetical protein